MDTIPTLFVCPLYSHNTALVITLLDNRITSPLLTLSPPYPRYTMQVAKQYPTLTFGEVSRLLGHMWRALPVDQKQTWGVCACVTAATVPTSGVATENVGLLPCYYRDWEDGRRGDRDGEVTGGDL